MSIIRSGRVVESGTLAQMRHLTRTSVTVELERDAAGLDALPGVHDLHEEGGRLHFEVDTAQLDGTVRALAERGVRQLTATPPTLEELFLRHYGDRS